MASNKSFLSMTKALKERINKIKMFTKEKNNHIK